MGLRNAVQCQRDGDKESCTAIIEAMGCTPLKQSRSKMNMFCYDERGSKYTMPMYENEMKYVLHSFLYLKHMILYKQVFVRRTTEFAGE